MGLEVDHRIQLLKNLINNAVNELSGKIRDPSEDEVDRWADLILQSMTTRQRAYHDINHIFDVFGCIQKPILVLAVLFHDIIYYSLDGHAFSEQQAKLLSDVVLETKTEDEEEDNNVNDNLSMRSSDGDGTLKLVQPCTDPFILMVLSVFGIDKDRNELPARNELLSALLAVRVLSPILNKVQLLHMTAAIEATIPFRSVDSEGKSAMDRLYDRLVKTNNDVFPCDLSEQELTHIVHDAVELANVDLSTFCTPDFHFFMDQNMKLMPEFYGYLIQPECTLSDFYEALISFHNRRINVEKIFVSFRGTPSVDIIEEKRQRTRQSLAMNKTYLRVRIFTVAYLLEVVAATTSSPNTQNNNKKIKHDIPLRFLPQVERNCLAEKQNGSDPYHNNNHSHPRGWDSEVYDLLVKSKAEGEPWELIASPLGRLIYEKIGQKGVDDALEENGSYTKSGYISEIMPPELTEKATQVIAQILGQENA